MKNLILSICLLGSAHALAGTAFQEAQGAWHCGGEGGSASLSFDGRVLRDVTLRMTSRSIGGPDDYIRLFTAGSFAICNPNDTEYYGGEMLRWGQSFQCTRSGKLVPFNDRWPIHEQSEWFAGVAFHVDDGKAYLMVTHDPYDGSYLYLTCGKVMR